MEEKTLSTTKKSFRITIEGIVNRHFAKEDNRKEDLIIAIHYLFYTVCVSYYYKILYEKTLWNRLLHKFYYRSFSFLDKKVFSPDDLSSLIISFYDSLMCDNMLSSNYDVFSDFLFERLFAKTNKIKTYMDQL